MCKSAQVVWYRNEISPCNMNTALNRHSVYRLDIQYCLFCDDLIDFCDISVSHPSIIGMFWYQFLCMTSHVPPPIYVTCKHAVGVSQLFIDILGIYYHIYVHKSVQSHPWYEYFSRQNLVMYLTCFYNIFPIISFAFLFLLI